jgi:hypothetical protein
MVTGYEEAEEEAGALAERLVGLAMPSRVACPGGRYLTG